MSTRENIRIIARTPYRQSTISDMQNPVKTSIDR